MADFDLGSYNTVAERIGEFRAKYPTGSLRPYDPAKPYWFETIGQQTFIVYQAVAMRSPGDIAPGIGLAWEPFPGKTAFTKDSELMNAETGAWGRSIVAALAADTRKGIATAEDVTRRREEQHEDTHRGSDWFVEAGWPGGKDEEAARRGALVERLRAAQPEHQHAFREWRTAQGLDVQRAMTREQVEAAEARVNEIAPEPTNGKAKPTDPDVVVDRNGEILPAVDTETTLAGPVCRACKSNPCECAPLTSDPQPEAEEPTEGDHSVPCSRCGSTRSKRMEVNGVWRCANVTSCDERVGIAEAKAHEDELAEESHAAFAAAESDAVAGEGS